MHLQHAPGTVRPLPSWNRAVALATPEGTRTTAPDHVRPQNTTATWTRPSAAPSYGDQPREEPALHGHEGTPAPRPRTVRPLLAVSPGRGTRRTRHRRGQSLCPSRAGATYCLHPDPATQARTAHHTVPRRLGRRTTKDSDRRGPRVQVTRSQDTLRQHSVSPLQRPTVGQEGQPAGLSTSKAANLLNRAVDATRTDRARTPNMLRPA